MSKKKVEKELEEGIELKRATETFKEDFNKILNEIAEPSVEKELKEKV